jgi:hypothetical protein
MIEIGAIYKHYKNQHCYQVIAIGKHSETLEDLVVYKALYKSDNFPEGQIWCRPLKMWNDLINGKPRFEKIIDNDIKL